MQGLEVKKDEAEGIRRYLISLGVLDFEKRPLARASTIVFALKPKAKVPAGIGKIVNANFLLLHQNPKSLADALKGKIPPSSLAKITKSFDVIGDIAVVEIPPRLEKYEQQVAKALLQVHKNVKVVVKKTSPMEGIFRTRKIAHIAGENRTYTQYRENGVLIHVDIAKMYFSPRLATERLRIAKQVKKGEHVLVMFAGCGPFALVIAKLQPSAKILGIEINPDAVEYFNKNIAANKAKNVVSICADVRDIGKANFGKYGRILMPLPKDAESFLGVALKCAKKGATIHLYSFSEISKGFLPALKKIREECKKAGLGCKILNKRVVRPFSPSTQQVVIDFQVS